MSPGSDRSLVSTGIALTAVALPTLIAFNVPPSATFFNQAAALVGWGGWLAWLTHSGSRAARSAHSGGLIALQTAFGLLAVMALAAPIWANVPLSIALSSVGMIAAAALATRVAASTANDSEAGAASVFRVFCLALLAAGSASSAVGLLQVFAPQFADGDWIARTSLAGRAVGNMRQPNHLSSLLLWGVIATVWLADARTLRRGVMWGVGLLFVFVIVLSGSRTGALGAGLLALWALIDRSLSRHARWMLGLTPLIYALFWLGMSAWAQLSHHVFGAETRFSTQGDVSSSRFAIWSNSLALIRAHQWAGVGFGEFNFAWTLTPFPDRPIAFFDHTHNIVLQLAVELGIPLALIVLSLFGWALVVAFRVAKRATGVDNAPLIQRAALVMVLMIALHSMLEYPLWYAYFLLPTAFAFGLCLAEPADERVPPLAQPNASAARTRPLLVASMLLMLGGLFSLYDYVRVVAIFAPPSGATPLVDRIADGRRSVFFSHHADYAAATTAEHPSDVMWAFKGAPHYLLDARLMQAWAVALDESGDTDRARYLAARLREFRNEQSEAFFAVCDEAPKPDAKRPFQCDPPSRTYTYLDFR
jgi:O-antigen ligase